MIVEQLLGKIEGFDTTNIFLDSVALTHDELMKPHQIVTSKEGEKIALSLPPGESLEAGDVIYADEKKIIYIDLTEEDILVIKPKDHIEWGKAAFNIGNLHHSAYMTEELILTPYDPVIEALISKIGVEYTRENRKLDGERANVRQGSHGHTHEHGHGHEHEQK